MIECTPADAKEWESVPGTYEKYRTSLVTATSDLEQRYCRRGVFCHR
jgi:hypothetical protein